ncbi:MAG: signal peptide peptidase SppA, partial [Burkholderiaceae bacterium]|nr:signal peptide peptidase SppA [Burkholderiaceae bacterium]
MAKTSSRSFVARVFGGLVALLDGTRRLLLNVLLLLLVAAALVWIWQRWHTPRLADRTTLVLELSGAIVDQPRAGSAREQALAQLRGGSPSERRLRDVLAVLDAAARDEQVTQAVL